jgi:hypothetical protein
MLLHTAGPGKEHNPTLKAWLLLNPHPFHTIKELKTPKSNHSKLGTVYIYSLSGALY